VEPHLVQQALRGGHWLSPEAEAHVESAVARLWVEMKPRCIAIASAAEEMPHSNTDSHACIAKLWRTMDHLEDALVGGDAQVFHWPGGGAHVGELGMHADAWTAWM